MLGEVKLMQCLLDLQENHLGRQECAAKKSKQITDNWGLFVQSALYCQGLLPEALQFVLPSSQLLCILERVSTYLLLCRVGGVGVTPTPLTDKLFLMFEEHLTVRSPI